MSTKEVPAAINQGEPNRRGVMRMPECVGVSLILSWGGTFYEDYSYQRKVKYLDIRGVLFVWTFWIQIPLKKYGVRGAVRGAK